MKLVTTYNRSYLSMKDEYGRVPNEQILIIAKTGGGKTLVEEGLAEEFYKQGYIVIIIADPKDELEYAYQMFEPQEKYHLEHLRKIGKLPSGKPVKIYHPFTFNIPNQYIPPINFFTFSYKDIGRREWSLIAETDYNNEAISFLLQASQNITKEDGLYGFAHFIQDSAKGKIEGRSKKANPRNLFLEATSGSMKSVGEVSRYLLPFRRDYFLAKDSCPININWKDILTDQIHYHFFASNWVKDEKLKDFVVLALLEGIRKNKEFVKKPVVVIIPEIRKLCPFRQEGHKLYLARGIKESLSLMRSSGRGMSSIMSSQVWEDIDVDVRNSPSITFFGQIGGGSDLDKISKSYNLPRDVRDLLKNPDTRNSFVPFGLKDSELRNQITIFFSSSMHGEESYNFFETYKKHGKDLIHSKTILEIMNKMVKEEEDKFRQRIKSKEKQEKEKQKKIQKEKEQAGKEGNKVEKKIRKAEEIQEKSKMQLRKLCYEMYTNENVDIKERSYNKISKKLGIKSHHTVKKYIEQYKEILQNQVPGMEDIESKGGNSDG